MYSLDWYRKRYAQARFRLFASPEERTLLESLATQEQLIAQPGAVAELDEQRLTHPQPMTDDEMVRNRCRTPKPGFSVAEFERTPGLPAWMEAVRQLQRLNRDGTYRIAFFVNAAPADCIGQDAFDDSVTKGLDDRILALLRNGTPAVSSHDAFMRFKPSTMPRANGHSIGNANDVKAGVLFTFLRDRVLTRLPVRVS